MAASEQKRNRIAVAFGEVLRAARSQAGLSQEALGLACGIDRTYVSLLERGERQPTLSTVFAIASELDVAAEVLVSQTAKSLPKR